VGDRELCAHSVTSTALVVVAAMPKGGDIQSGTGH